MSFKSYRPVRQTQTQPTDRVHYQTATVRPPTPIASVVCANQHHVWNKMHSFVTSTETVANRISIG